MSETRRHRRRTGRRSYSSALLLSLAGITAIGPVGYPAWLALATRRTTPLDPPAPEEWPGVTVVVPAYREAGIIDVKIDNLQRTGYPGELQIIVIAEDPETASAARRPGVDLIEPPERLGKAAALNLGFDAARHPIVVMTDANAMLAPGSLSAMARWLTLPDVGAVAGEKRVQEGHEGAYWRFEAWLKRRESRRRSTIGLVGELAAVRREAFRHIPRDVAVDDLWLALDVIEQGLRIVYEPEAETTEDANDSWREDWERRTRIVSGAVDVMLRRRGLLDPRSPIAIELWGHRLVRYTAGPAAHAALLAWSLARSGTSRPAQGFAIAHLFAGVALLRGISGQKLSRPETVASQVLFLQLVALGGLARYLRNDRPAIWPKQVR